MKDTCPILLLMTLCAFLVLPASASAQQKLFLQKKEYGQVPPPSNSQEQKQEELPEADKTAISNEIANQYYKNCLAQEHHSFTPDGHQMLCACTTAKMQESMSMEEMKTMFEDTQAGQDMRNKMLINVYAPCMQYPARDLVFTECIGNPNVTGKLKKARSVCKCMADGMASYVAERGPNVILGALRRNRNDTDPLSTLVNSHGFQEESEHYMTKCVYTHEFGYK